MKCSESLQQKIEALAAGELNAFAARGVERHARECAACASRLADARALNAALKGMAKEMPSDGLREHVFAKMDAVHNSPLTTGEEGWVRGEAPVLPSVGKDYGPQGSTLTPNPSPFQGEGSAPHAHPPFKVKSRRTRKKLVLEMAAVLGISCVIAAVLFPTFAQTRAKARITSSLYTTRTGKVESNLTQDYDESYQPTKGIYAVGSGSPTQFGGEAPSPGGESGKFKSPVNSQWSGTLRDASGEAELASGASPFVANPGGQNKPNAFSANTTPAAPDRYLIRNATLVVEVKDARAGYNTLSNAVKTSRGYLNNLVETVDALGSRTITMQVRVPATQFDSSMTQLSSLGKVMSKNVTAEDVTEEYVDTESTLRNLNRTETRLLEHLGRTGKLSDTLLVEKELTRVRAEIEQREGRLRFLSHRVSFSTMDVTLQEAAKSQPAVPPKSYSSGKEAAEASRSLVEFLRSVWTTVIWIGIWAVVWLPLAVFGGWLGRRVLRAWSEASSTNP
jgi:hypothetical protein